MNGCRIKVGFVVDLQPGLNSKNFKVEIISIGKPVASRQEMIPTNSFHQVQEMVFRLPATFNCQAIDGEEGGRGEPNTFSHCMYRRRHFVSTSHMMLHAHAWLKLNTPSLVSRHVSRPAQCSFSVSCTSPSFTGSSSRSITSRIHCADSRAFRGDGFTDPEPRTGYEPQRTVDNRIVTEQEIEHCTEESQIPEIEDKGRELIYDPFSLPYNQALLSSTQDSIGSLAAPQEADLDDEQIRALLASPRYLLEREASAERSQIYHSEREDLKSSSSQRLNFMSTGKTAAWLSHQKRLRSRRIFRKKATC